MSDRTWIAAVALALAGCGGSPADEPAARDDALLGAAQAPLDRAADVQQTLDARAKKAADAAAALEARDAAATDGEAERP
jgi:hypothetical protein